MLDKLVKLGEKVELIKVSDFSKKNGIEKYTNVNYSMISDFNDDEKTIIVQAPFKHGVIVPLEMEIEYYIYIYVNESRVYRAKCKVEQRMIENNIHLLKLKLTSELLKHQRREYYRLSYIKEFNYKKKGENNFNPGTMINISGGGAKFNVPEEINKNIQLRLRFQLIVNEVEINFEVDGIVLDFEKVEKDVYSVRVCFINVSELDREQIIKYIFEEERKRRKMQKSF